MICCLEPGHLWGISRSVAWPLQGLGPRAELATPLSERICPRHAGCLQEEPKEEGGPGHNQQAASKGSELGAPDIKIPCIRPSLPQVHSCGAGVITPMHEGTCWQGLVCTLVWTVSSKAVELLPLATPAFLERQCFCSIVTCAGTHTQSRRWQRPNMRNIGMATTQAEFETRSTCTTYFCLQATEHSYTTWTQHLSRKLPPPAQYAHNAAGRCSSSKRRCLRTSQRWLRLHTCCMWFNGLRWRRPGPCCPNPWHGLHPCRACTLQLSFCRCLGRR